MVELKSSLFPREERLEEACPASQAMWGAGGLLKGRTLLVTAEAHSHAALSAFAFLIHRVSLGQFRRNSYYLPGNCHDIIQ